MCILNLFSGMRTAGTWPMHCVRSSYLVGFVMCGGVAKGSGNVDFFFQHNHMNPAATLPCPWGLCCLSLQLGRSLLQNWICWRQKELTSYFLILEHSSVPWGPSGLR